MNHWEVSYCKDGSMYENLVQFTPLGKIQHYRSGMHAWLGAAADTRYSVVAPIIGVQVVVPETNLT